MDPATLLIFWHENYTLRMAVLGSGTLGIISGALGTFAVLRRQSLLGDAVSHSALPGIALAFLLTNSKNSLVLVIGAALAGWLATLVMMAIVRMTHLKFDTALGLVLSVFFGLGLMLLVYIQRRAGAHQAGLTEFLYGQPATIVQQDLLTMAGLGALALLLMVLFWKQFKLLSFDPDFGATLGLAMRGYDVLLTTLLVIAIVIGLQTVGVVLMSTMLVAPAAAARQWTDRLSLMALLAAGFGAIAGVGGVLVSTQLHFPPGPTIVIVASFLVLVSLFGAPNRGLLWNGVRQLRQRRRLRLEAVLGDLYVLAGQHEHLDHGHPTAVLQTMSVGLGGVERTLAELAARGWARRVGPDAWALTPTGFRQAERLVQERHALEFLTR